MSTTTNITTLNQLVENFREIANQHLQINNFLYGEPWEFYQSGTTRSPELWLACDSVDRDPKGGVTTYVMNVVLADNVKRGEVNELEVESDLEQICEDVIAQCYNNNYGWVVDSNSIKITIRNERTPKNLTTAEFQIRIKTKKPNNRCAIPFNTNPLT